VSLELGAPSGVATYAMFSDPAGNTVGLVEDTTPAG